VRKQQISGKNTILKAGHCSEVVLALRYAPPNFLIKVELWSRSNAERSKFAADRHYALAVIPLKHLSLILGFAIIST
jgi:hypothetical protein